MSLAALPLRSGEGIVGVLAVGSVAACDFSRQATFLEAMSHGIAAGIQNAFLYEQLKNHATQLEREIAERIRAEEALLDHQRRLRSLASELSLAEERERRRIATGLHDHACQTLVLSKMKLQELRPPLAPAQEDEIAHICSTLDGTIGNVRELIFDLSSNTWVSMIAQSTRTWSLGGMATSTYIVPLVTVSLIGETTIVSSCAMKASPG